MSAPPPPSVMLLLLLHLCVFTMLGMLLFTGEKVRAPLCPCPRPWGLGWWGDP